MTDLKQATIREARTAEIYAEVDPELQEKASYAEELMFGELLRIAANKEVDMVDKDNVIAGQLSPEVTYASAIMHHDGMVLMDHFWWDYVCRIIAKTKNLGVNEIKLHRPTPEGNGIQTITLLFAKRNLTPEDSAMLEQLLTDHREFIESRNKLN